MNPIDRLLISNATGVALSDVGDVTAEPVAAPVEAAPVSPTAPIFNLQDFLPAIESQKLKATAMGFVGGAAVVGAVALLTRRKKGRGRRQ